MTPQEAIKRLTDIVKICSGGRGPATLHGEPLPREYEEFRQINFGALDMAVAALEKQTPKKPTEYPGYEGKCVSCGAVFLDKLTAYCGNCGQRLDWGQEDMRKRDG